MLVIKIDDDLKEFTKELIRDNIMKSLLGSGILVSDDCKIYIGDKNERDLELKISKFTLTKL